MSLVLGIKTVRSVTVIKDMELKVRHWLKSKADFSDLTQLEDAALNLKAS